MSSETKNIISKWFGFVLEQLSKGNVIPAVVTAVGIYFGYTEAYVPIKAYLNGLSDTDAYIVANYEHLEVELERLKEELNKRRASEPFGEEINAKFGINYGEHR